MIDRGRGRRQKILRVSNELLAEILKLPPGTRITGVSDQQFFTTDSIAIKIEHPSFAPVEPENVLPECTALYTEVRTAVFEGWIPADRING